MNTIRSVGYGWGVLIAAGGGAYYFAKKEINKDREIRGQENRNRLAQQAAIREQEYTHQLRTAQQNQPASLSSSAGQDSTLDHAGKPGQEASSIEPAPTRHAPENEGQRVVEKSKYEASEVWRSKKGDRFS